MPPARVLAARLKVHWLDLRKRPAAWVALPRNLIPAFGVIALGWSGLEAVAFLWIDLALAFLMLLAALVPRAMRDLPRLPGSGFRRIAVGIFTFMLLAAILGIPIWISLGMLIAHASETTSLEAALAMLGSLSFLGSVAAAAVGHALAVPANPFDTLAESDLVRQLRLAFWPLFLRAMVMLYIAGLSLFPALFLVLIALVQTWLDWWPETATRWAHGRRWDRLETDDSTTRQRLKARMAELKQRARQPGS